MNPSEDHDDFLAAVMKADIDADFRSAQLNLMLHAVRRRRRIGLWQRRITGGAVWVLTAAFVVWILFSSGLFLPKESHPSPVRIVHTTPSLFPTTVSSTTRSVRQVTSTPGKFHVVITTAQAPCYREIGDDELTGLLALRSGALIRRGPHEAEVVFPPDKDPSPN
jgi:hypothetical protein